MRLVHVSCRYSPHVGGVETLIQELSQKLVEKGHQVSIYALDRELNLPKKQLLNGVLVRRFKPVFGDPVYLPPLQFFRAIRQDPSNILHVHDIHSLLGLSVTFFKRTDQKLILQPHYHRFAQSLPRQLLFFFYKYLLDVFVFSKAAEVIVNSRYEAKIVQEDFKQCKKIVLIPQCIPISELKQVRWNPEYPKRILYVGSLQKYKNVDKIIRAFSLLVRTRKNDIALVIVGEGPEKKHLLRLASDLGVNDRIEWKRNLSPKKLLVEYAKAQVFVLFSSLESFSRVIHEALIIGVPTAVLSAGATGELVKKGLVKGVDSLEEEEVARVIAELLSSKRFETSLENLAALDPDRYSDEIIKIYRACTHVGGST